MKWLALLTWIGYGYQFAVGSWPTRLLIAASISNFFLFFGKDILRRMKSGNRKMITKAKDIAGTQEAFHRCAVCGITDQSHPSMEFRYCPECAGLGYCKDHIQNHTHRKK